ncbi:hypothetical protein AB0A74_31590 [Saccharothrix sp. NPDC042600]|uniref:hypothetical protein n=1 Tax=Saccharothrix TaxID=2071 RepID=UPI0033FB8508|nr:hypothetical protein GCM10017745_07830 [Saccharothrix mutabilis subsp. capreolus]
MEQGYAVFLLLGVVLVLIDGQLIYRSGRAYMNRAYGDPEAARSMTALATVLFHLVVLGLLALVSIITVDTGDPVKDVVVKLGVVLLLLALVHAVTMMILGRIRDRQLQQQLADEMAEEHRLYEREHNVPSQAVRVEPVPPVDTTRGRPVDTTRVDPTQIDPRQIKTTR